MVYICYTVTPVLHAYVVPYSEETYLTNSSRHESSMTSPSASNPASAGNTLTSLAGAPLLLVEAALSSSPGGRSEDTRETIGREVGAGVTADVGGVGVLLEVSGAQGAAQPRMAHSQQPSRAPSPEKDDWEPIMRQR